MRSVASLRLEVQVVHEFLDRAHAEMPDARPAHGCCCCCWILQRSFAVLKAREDHQRSHPQGLQRSGQVATRQGATLRRNVCLPVCVLSTFEILRGFPAVQLPRRHCRTCGGLRCLGLCLLSSICQEREDRGGGQRGQGTGTFTCLLSGQRRQVRRPDVV